MSSVISLSTSDKSAVSDSMQSAPIGVILISQGPLASSFKEGVENMLGGQEALTAINLSHDDTLNSAAQKVAEALEDLPEHRGVIILADIFGGTPCNAAMRFYTPGEIEVMAGVNLPLLVKLMKSRDGHSLSEVVEQSHNAGLRYLISCGEHIQYS